MKSPEVSGTRERILFLLKTRGPQTAVQLAKPLKLTTVGVRQHLAQLSSGGLVDFHEARGGVGRPARTWRVTEEGDRRFPEGYADLALEIITGVKAAFGDAGLERLVSERTRQQVDSYRDQMPPKNAPLAKHVAAIARIRSGEGYMAEWRAVRDGFMLVENHCPICAAAQFCQGLCGAELELFGTLLGEDVEVERTEHILEGARRCCYRIRMRG